MKAGFILNIDQERIIAELPNDILLKVEISADKARVALVVPAEFPREQLTPQACQKLLKESGIRTDEGLVKAVGSLVAKAKQDPGEHRAVVAESIPSVPGEEGRVEWLVGENGPEELSADPVDFYEKSAYTLIETEQVIAKIIPPTKGTPGSDIFGKTITAKNGRSVKLILGKSIQKKSNGELVAKADGPLVREGKTVKILELIEVPEFVDFSTGNIKFNGDVHIRKGVRDRFEVETTGNVIVDGLVEAATIKCGGCLVVRGGFAGREMGHAEVGGNMIGRYLDNVQGKVKGELQIDREIVNCELTVTGKFNSPSVTIMGGQITCLAQAEVAVLGSPTGVPTHLVLQAKKASASLTVHRWLRADTVIHIAGKAFKIHKDVRGPIRIHVGVGKQVVYTRDQADPMPLIHIATAQSDAA